MATPPTLLPSSNSTEKARRLYSETLAPNASTLIVAALVVAALYLGQSVLIPVALAILLAFVLSPVVRFLRKWKLPSVVAVTTVVLLTFGILITGGLLVAKQVTGLAENISRYDWALKNKIREFRGATKQSEVVKQAADTIQDLGKELSKTAGETSKPSVSDASDPSETSKPIPVEIHEPQKPMLEIDSSFIGKLLHPLAAIGLVFLFLTFLLVQRQDLRDRFIRLAGEHDIERTTAAMVEAGDRLSRFFLLQTGLNAIFGVVIGLGLWAIGVPNPLLWGGVAFIMRYVPYIGAFLSAGFPLILAAAVDPTWTMFLWTLLLFLIAEPLMGHVIEPVVYGRNTGLSPFAVIVAAAFWTTLWGPIGLILSTPLTLIFVTMGRHIERLAFLNIIFGDEPALGAAEGFYQRILANNPEEATEIAELYLKNHSLLTIYDEIVLKCLRLAQDYAERGAIETVKLETIAENISAAVDDLTYIIDEKPQKKKSEKSEPTVQPSRELDEIADCPDLPILTEDNIRQSWRTNQPVLCVAGRSPLDRAAAELFVQLLSKHGIQASIQSQKELVIASSSKSMNEEVRAVVLSYLSVGRRTAHIKSILVRIRRTYPDAIVIAGLWNNVNYSVNRENIGADHVFMTLRDAVETCINAAMAVKDESDSSASISRMVGRTASELSNR